MRITARNVAVEALLQVEENTGYSNIVLDKALRKHEMEQRDRALTSLIFYGVLEKQITLDYYLSFCLTKSSGKTDKTAKMILLSALYQMIFMDRIPESAAVNEAVNATRDFQIPQFSGFVNGVFRTFLRKKEEILLPKGNTPFALSIRYSVPEELIGLWMDSYGFEVTVKLLGAFSEKPKTYIRINTLKTTEGKLSETLKKKDIKLISTNIPNCAVLESQKTVTELEEFHEGLFHVQDLSAQLICKLFHPRKGESVCDCCAAPGGKSFTIAEMMENTGRIDSFDLYKGRVGLIRSGADRLGITNIHAAKKDAAKGFRDIPPVDRMLCDVPCSGFGVIRRKPEIRYKTLASVKELPAVQLAILTQASRAVKEGGILAYATCTLNPKENREVAERFLRENRAFQPRVIDIPNGFARVLDEPGHMLTMFPFAGASDGFFVALFKRLENEE